MVASREQGRHGDISAAFHRRSFTAAIGLVKLGFFQLGCHGNPGTAGEALASARDAGSGRVAGRIILPKGPRPLVNDINAILDKIKDLEKELEERLRGSQNKLLYTVNRKKVLFSEKVRQNHRLFAAKLSDYVYDSGLLIILTIPLVWSALIPMLVLDAMVVIFQAVCFPVYGIPRVKRGDYVVIDRHKLGYLNWMEKLNCVYCGYFNGLIGFVREVAARTEQYWCPVRHARPIKSVHGRYRHFFEYGDAKGYREGLPEVRGKFDDLE
jgi:hypothetical protein